MTIHLNVRKNFGDFCLDLYLQADNEVLGLLGASGCGKSMTLKCIAGVERPDEGSIVLDDKILFDSRQHINLAPQKRRVGFLFQNYALFPQMTVLDNIRMGARREKNTASRNVKVAEIMERFEITDLSNRYPAQISGGQQQRTALARILVSDPEILLLDEPFSALDTHLRFRLERELREVARDFGKTVFLVTHDRDEAFRLADKIAILNHGSVEVCGSKTDIFHNPTTKQAAILTGCKNFSSFVTRNAHQIYATDWGIILDVSQYAAKYHYVGIRMHDILYGAGPNQALFTVLEEIENPFSYTIMVRAKEMPNALPLAWEVDKTLWQNVRASELLLHIPRERVMLLN
ncbi:MAG: sulfate/molybdate ABC transporter ATP-binding protein [Peptococcaceae bacterium]|nr:sulfate/molybdate ABC transporter ATP-binding protein [Peptococcaceae bacterium]